MPNRASLMTGRYPSVHGLHHNGCLLPERANTFVDVLAAAGWRTAAVGKCLLQPFLETPASSAALMCLEMAGADRMMFGSDFPHNIGDTERCLAQINDLPPDQARSVRFESAQKLFGL